MDQNEIALIRKAQCGDCTAFENLIKMYDKNVLSLALNMVGNEEDAKDIYQEVLIRAFQSLKTFRFQSEFFTWLYRITVNYTINFRKKKRFRASFYVDCDLYDQEKFQDMETDNSKTPEQDAEYKDFQKHLYRVLESLPHKQRSVFVLRFFHDQKLLDIAEIMGWKLGTVKNSLFRATQKVKQQLEALELA